MSKRRRGVRIDTRPPQDEGRAFAAPVDSDAVPFLGAGNTVGHGPGQMLRAMREAAGIDAALVASALKVAPQKIDALEAERYNELPDVTFARGLAAAFCRAFGADPAPVLARMPMPESGLHATGNTNQLMPGSLDAGGAAPSLPLPRPLFWGVLVLLLAALVIWLLPASPGTPSTPTAEPVPLPAPAPAITEPEHTVQPPPALPASDAEAAKAAASAASEVASAAAQPASAPPSQAAAASGKLLGFEALEDVWVEVVDAGERVLVTRTIAKGQRVNVDDGALPLSVRVGRRDAVRVTVRGKPYDLAKAGGSGAVARFQVK
ncbi:MAG: helix-turn-helix domain-containing protein [Ottowia sp.]|nr:helix-turn-helix domain-containing protein [Ottowia sp.]